MQPRTVTSPRKCRVGKQLNTNIMYTIYNKITGSESGSYKTYNAARRAADKKDNIYGACVNFVRALKL